MNSPLGTKNRPWRARLSLVNGETSATIEAGRLVCLSASDPGKVVLPSTATSSTAHTMFTGVAANTAVPGESVEIICSGYAASAAIVTQTRGMSTDSYASVASRPQGAIFTINTALNVFTYSAASASTINNPAYAILVGTMASIQSAASTVTDTSVYKTSSAKLWIRGLV